MTAPTLSKSSAGREASDAPSAVAVEVAVAAASGITRGGVAKQTGAPAPTTTKAPFTPNRILGYGAMIIAIIMWSSFALGMRAIALSELSVYDVALIRYGVPVLIFAWWIPRAIREARAASGVALTLIIVGAGLPFYLLSAWGGAISSAGYVGVIGTGTAPLFVAILALLIWKKRIPPRAYWGLAAVILGVAALVIAAPSGIGALACGILVLAGLLWGLYTMGLGRAGIHPISAILVLCVPSTIATALCLVTGIGESHLLTAPIEQTLGFVAAQGIGVGVIASLAYIVAIQHLGAVLSSTLGALSPVLVVIAAVPLFGETLGLIALVGIVLIVMGVIAVNSAPTSSKPPGAHKFRGASAASPHPSPPPSVTPTRKQRVVFSSLPVPAVDPLWEQFQMHRADPRPDRMNLVIGVYRDDTGVCPTMSAVRIGELRRLERDDSKEYIGPHGNLRFNALMTELIVGPGVHPDRLTTFQTVAGTGALRLLADLVVSANPDARVLIGTPSYSNHAPIFRAAGLEVVTHRYLDAEGRVDRDEIVVAILTARPGDVVLLHGCCHNPTGTELSGEDWIAIAQAAERAGVIPLVDFAYYGLGNGLDADVAGARSLLDYVPEALISVSGSKAFGLYNERAGCAIVMSGQREAGQVRGTLENLSRTTYSQPPEQGAAVVAEILGNPELRTLWVSELGAMRERISSIRTAVLDFLPRELMDQPAWQAVTEHRGMFSQLPLGPAQMERLRREFGVYGTASARFNFAGASSTRLEELAHAIARVAEASESETKHLLGEVPSESKHSTIRSSERSIPASV